MRFLIPALLFPALLQAQPVRYEVNPLRAPQAFNEAVDAGTRTRTGVPGAAYWQNSATYDLFVNLDVDAKTVDGTVAIRYTNASPDTIPMLHLDLYQNVHAEGAMRNEPAEVTGGYRLDWVVLNGDTLRADGPRNRRYVVDGTRLVLIGGAPLMPGQAADIRIGFGYKLPQAGIGERMGYSRDNFFFLAYFHPRMTVYDDVLGWHPDPFLQRAEFYHGFADYTVTIETDSKWIVMGTGELQNPEQTLAPAVLERYRDSAGSDRKVTVVGAEDFATATAPSADGKHRWRFRATKVADVAYSVTRESVWESARTSTGGGFTRIHSFYRKEAPLWTETLRYAQHAITFLSKQTGIDYPWPHMTVVEGAGIMGGGMEYPMMTLIGDYNRAGASALQSVTAHELAHMWVPLIVSTDERRYAWFDEGYTDFHTDLADEDFRDVDNIRINTFRSYLWIAGTDHEGPLTRRSDGHYTSMAYGIASYAKPSAIQWMLRSVLGVEQYEAMHRAFWAAWAYKHPTPWDLFNFYQSYTGMDLNWFITPWYHSTGVLDQAVVAVGDRGRETEIMLRDLGDNPMPYRLRLTTSDGTTHDFEVPVDRVIQAQGADFSVRFPVRNVVAVEIDADQRFADRNRRNNRFERN